VLQGIRQAATRAAQGGPGAGRLPAATEAAGAARAGPLERPRTHAPLVATAIHQMHATTQQMSSQAGRWRLRPEQTCRRGAGAAECMRVGWRSQLGFLTRQAPGRRQIPDQASQPPCKPSMHGPHAQATHARHQSPAAHKTGNPCETQPYRPPCPAMPIPSRAHLHEEEPQGEEDAQARARPREVAHVEAAGRQHQAEGSGQQWQGSGGSAAGPAGEGAEEEVRGGELRWRREPMIMHVAGVKPCPARNEQPFLPHLWLSWVCM
jgi:hypothetical protein